VAITPETLSIAGFGALVQLTEARLGATAIEDRAV
jgi:hypothetical protein